MLMCQISEENYDMQILSTNYPMEICLYLKFGGWMTNSIHPDKTAQIETYHLELHCSQSLLLSLVLRPVNPLESCQAWFVYLFP